MSITNYWFQLIWLLTVGMVLAISLPKKQEIVMGRIEEQIRPVLVFGMQFQVPVRWHNRESFCNCRADPYRYLV